MIIYLFLFYVTNVLGYYNTNTPSPNFLLNYTRESTNTNKFTNKPIKTINSKPINTSKYTIKSNNNEILFFEEPKLENSNDKISDFQKLYFIIHIVNISYLIISIIRKFREFHK